MNKIEELQAVIEGLGTDLDACQFALAKEEGRTLRARAERNTALAVQDALEKELSAAQSEIERLKGLCDRCEAELMSYAVKLENLRTETERFTRSGSLDTQALLGAIEAIR